MSRVTYAKRLEASRRRDEKAIKETATYRERRKKRVRKYESVGIEVKRPAK